ELVVDDSVFRLRMPDCLAVHLHIVGAVGIADAEAKAPQPILSGKLDAIRLVGSNPHRRKGLLDRLRGDATWRELDVSALPTFEYLLRPHFWQQMQNFFPLWLRLGRLNPKAE